MPDVKNASLSLLLLGCSLLLGSVGFGQTQKWAPMPVPVGTVIPVNSHVDSSGNIYAINDYLITKTTPAGVMTAVAEAHHLTGIAAGIHDYYFSDLVLDGSDNLYAAETNNGIGGGAFQYEYILKVAPDGTTTAFTVFSGALPFGKLPNASSLTVADGDIYTVGMDGAIYELKADGTLLVVAPNAWFYDNIGNFPNPPQGLTIDANHVLYTRVTRLNLQPSYTGPLALRPLTSAPIITFQPQGGTVTFGTAKVLTVIAAVDGPPLSYQWYRDGVAIDGASGLMTDVGSNSFSANYGALLPGTYTVVISTGDPLTAVTSDPVVVTTTGPGGIPVGRTPLITTQPADGVFDYGSSVSLSVSALSTLPLRYQWQLNGKDLPQATGSSYTAAESGNYTVNVTTDIGSVTSRTAAVSLANRPVNVSSRVLVGTSDDVAIAGFIISGTPGRLKEVLVRAVGPGLTPFGLSSSEVLAQPFLKIFDAKGELYATNRGWNDLDSLSDAAKAIGAFALPPGSRDAAMLLEMPPGSYTAQVSGMNGTTGVALVEVYERLPDSGHFVNISTRASVGTGGNILIGGFIVGGVHDSRILLRAVGPGLVAKGVPGVLTQPVLSVYNASGQLIAINVGWSTGTSADTLALASTASRIGAFALQPGSTDCAMLLSLRPGAYTVEVTGVNNSTGVALFEAYQVPSN